MPNLMTGTSAEPQSFTHPTDPWNNLMLFTTNSLGIGYRYPVKPGQPISYSMMIDNYQSEHPEGIYLEVVFLDQSGSSIPTGRLASNHVTSTGKITLSGVAPAGATQMMARAGEVMLASGLSTFSVSQEMLTLTDAPYPWAPAKGEDLISIISTFKAKQ